LGLAIFGLLLPILGLDILGLMHTDFLSKAAEESLLESTFVATAFVAMVKNILLRRKSKYT
jgi:hypothetical protein